MPSGSSMPTTTHHPDDDAAFNTNFHAVNNVCLPFLAIRLNPRCDNLSNLLLECLESAGESSRKASKQKN
jgi:hypothetical protein